MTEVSRAEFIPRDAREAIEYELCGLAGEQVGAEIAMLRELLHSQHDLDETVRFTKAIRVPTELGPTCSDLLCAIIDVHRFSPPVTPDSVLERIQSFGWDRRRHERFVRLLARSPRGEGSAAHYAALAAGIATQRFDLGQLVWPIALYRWYDAADRLLYVGISKSLAQRQDSHARRSSWEQFAVRSTIVRYPTRRDAEEMERAAIIREQPLFNHVHNDTPEARARLVAYLVAHGRTDLLAPAVSRG